MKKICYLIGAMEPECVLFSTKKSQLVIAADGGLRHLEARGIRPDYVVGDFDSLGCIPCCLYTSDAADGLPRWV